MQVASRKTVVLLVGLVSVLVLPGCTDWKKKYENLNVEHQNLRGQIEYEKSAKGELAEQVSASQQTIEELRKQIEEQKKSPAMASGFGEGYDVSFDAAAGTITVRLPNAILFDSGKAELRKTTISELDHIKLVLQEKYASKPVDVIGHTDSDPIKKSKWKDNWELSAQRSLSVLRYLVKRGIQEEKIRAIGRGDSQPIASNATAAGKAKNRRVEIVVHMK